MRESSGLQNQRRLVAKNQNICKWVCDGCRGAPRYPWGSSAVVTSAFAKIMVFRDHAPWILEARALAHMEGRRVEPDTSYKPHFASKIGQFKGACSKTPNDKDVCHSAVLGARSLSFGDFADALKLAKSGGGVGFA